MIGYLFVYLSKKKGINKGLHYHMAVLLKVVSLLSLFSFGVPKALITSLHGSAFLQSSTSFRYTLIMFFTPICLHFPHPFFISFKHVYNFYPCGRYSWHQLRQHYAVVHVMLSTDLDERFSLSTLMWMRFFSGFVPILMCRVRNGIRFISGNAAKQKHPPKKSLLLAIGDDVLSTIGSRKNWQVL